VAVSPGRLAPRRRLRCLIASAAEAETYGLTAEVLSDATGAINIANEAGFADAKTVHTTLLVLHLTETLTVDRLATRAHMSRRTFIRAFRASTVAAPASWIRSRRLDEARRLLESTDLPVDRVADACGFGSAVTLRQSFAAALGTSPSVYRRRFDARVTG
jgi:AraC-like DNA-binding protein